MTDLHARETTPPDWDGIVVELVEEERVVGIVYLEDGVPLAEYYPDEDGEPWVFDVADLHRVLDVAAQMLGVDEEAPAAPGGDPVDVLAAEFDSVAIHRGAEDEGFYPVPGALAIVVRADALDLAVIKVEGFSLESGEPHPVAGLSTDVGAAQRGEAWPTFRAGCNAQARAVLERWAARGGVAVALEVEDAAGESFVL